MLPSSLKQFYILISLIFLAGLSAAPWTSAQAQPSAWQPTKPLRMVVPFPAGGTGDVLMRTVAEPLSALWKQPVLVENRAGAGTVIATDHVSKQTGDGSVWLQVAGSFVSNAIVRPKLPYDPVRDFTPVVLLANSPVVLAVNSNLGAKTVQELIALARSKPGELSIATIGPATTQHILVEMLKLAGKDLLEGVIIGLANWPGRNQADLEKRFSAKTGEPWFGHDSIFAYAHTMILKEAIEKAGGRPYTVTTGQPGLEASR